MKRFFIYALMVALFAAPAFAAKNSQSLNISSPVAIGVTQLPAGNYNVSWTGTGTNVQVTISRSGKSPITVPATLVDEKNGQSGYLINHVDGVDQLETLHLSKVTLTLQKSTAVAGQ